jgi:Fe-S-cluster containining protein
MCCKILVIEELEKDAGPLCKHCKIGKGCKIYTKRPNVCREYECGWMLNRDMGPQLRPDKTGTILQVDPDTDEFQAVCDPATPMQWRKSPLVFKYLVAKAKEGNRVVAKSGLRSWQIYEDGSWGPTA